MSSQNNLTPVERMDGHAAARTTPMLALLELGTGLLSDMSIDRVCFQVTRLTKEVVAGTGDTSVTMLRSGRAAMTVAATGPLATGLDEHQYSDGAGPCLQAATTGQPQHVPDMCTETRWPKYTAHALQEEVLSSLSLPLLLTEGTVASLNIYALRGHAFDEHAQQLAEHIARCATATITNINLYTSARQLADQLQQAIASRAVIEQAKGIIMGDRRCDAGEAIDLLKKVSQDANRKLRDVAAALVERAQAG